MCPTGRKSMRGTLHRECDSSGGSLRHAGAAVVSVTIFDPRLGVAKKMATQDVIWVERGQRIRTAQIARRPYRPNRKSSL